MLAVLRQRGFALLWLAGLVSQLGDWALFIALPFWVYERTGSVPATGVTLALYNVPRLLLSPVAGVLVDRCDRRRTLITADLCSAALLLPLLLASSPVGVPVLPVVYAVVFAQACVVHVVGPASGALVPLVVAAPQLVAANAFTTLTGGVARLVGPSLGGALLGFAGFDAVVVVDVASFLVSAALVALVAVRPATAAPAAAVDPPAPLRPAGHAHPTGSPGTGVGPHPMHLWADLGQGFRLIAGVRRLRVVLCAGGLVMVGYGAVTVLLAAFVRDVLGGGALGFGGLATAQGVGTLLGSALVAQAGSAVRPACLFALSQGVTGLALLATFNAPALALALPGMALAGGGIAGSTAGERTLLQTAVPNRYVGRILGAFGTSNGSFILVGMGAASALAGPLGVVAALNLAAALYVAAAALALLWLPAPEPRGQPAQ